MYRLPSRGAAGAKHSKITTKRAVEKWSTYLLCHEKVRHYYLVTCSISSNYNSSFRRGPKIASYRLDQRASKQLQTYLFSQYHFGKKNKQIFHGGSLHKEKRNTRWFQADCAWFFTTSRHTDAQQSPIHRNSVLYLALARSIFLYSIINGVAKQPEIFHQAWVILKRDTRSTLVAYENPSTSGFSKKVIALLIRIEAALRCTARSRTQRRCLLSAISVNRLTYNCKTWRDYLICLK